jgi:MFS family permease
MDRESLRALRRQPGYTRFLGAATLARLADEMFSVAVVLLVLERTGSAALAGATVAAITLPSALTGPVLGAWLDVTGRRRGLMVFDQLVISASLVGLVLLAGHGPNVLLPLVALAAGLTYPLSFGGFTSLIPVLVPEELLPPANAIEASSFNFALVIGPALAGTIAALAGPATAQRGGAQPRGAGADRGPSQDRRCGRPPGPLARRCGALRAAPDRRDPGATRDYSGRRARHGGAGVPERGVPVLRG